jgi:hypothetical protein
MRFSFSLPIIMYVCRVKKLYDFIPLFSNIWCTRLSETLHTGQKFC